MKVLVLTPWYPTKKNKTYGIFVKEQTEALVQHGVNPTIFYYDGQRRINLNTIFSIFKNNTYKEIEADGKIEVFRINGIHLPLKLQITKRLWIDQYLKFYKKFKMQHGEPDLIHAHTHWAGSIALEIKRKYKIPYVLTEHSSSLMTKQVQYLRNQNIKLVYDHADSLIAVSPVLASYLKTITKNKINVIPNSIDSNFFTPLNAPRDNSQYTVTSIGGLTEIKRMSLAIESVVRLKQKGYNVKLNIVGEGPLHTLLQTQINNFEAENYIELKGALNRIELKEILDETDIFLLCSKSETFGVVLIEAMMMGIPIITTNSGGPSSIVTPATGIILKEDNPDYIANSLEYIFKNRNNYSSEIIRNYAVNNFSNDAITKKIVDIYKRAIG